MPAPIITFKSYNCPSQLLTLTVHTGGGLPEQIIATVVPAGTSVPNQPPFGNTIIVTGYGDFSTTIFGGPTSGSYDVYWWVRTTSDRFGPCTQSCGALPPVPPIPPVPPVPPVPPLPPLPPSPPQQPHGGGRGRKKKD